jgi:transposase
MTISLRNDDGNVILRRQVSTRWPKLAEFREQLHQALADDEKHVAVVEVCGFHDWLVKWLQQDERCHQVLVVQPLGRTANKTDRRDANALSELLWVNRERLLRGDRVQGVRAVYLPSAEQQADRHLTQLRERLVRKRTQTLNQIQKILRRHNLGWEQPTRMLSTGERWRPGAANAETPAAADGPRQARLWRPRRTMLSALSASEADAAGSSTGSSPLSPGEEATRCPA